MILFCYELPSHLFQLYSTLPLHSTLGQITRHLITSKLSSQITTADNLLTKELIPKRSSKFNFSLKLNTSSTKVEVPILGEVVVRRSIYINSEIHRISQIQKAPTMEFMIHSSYFTSQNFNFFKTSTTGN